MNSDIDDIFKGRINELAAASALSGRFTFTDFLTPAQRSYILKNERSLPAEINFFGGYEAAERVIAGFGSLAESEYEVPYPISILHIRARNTKFSDKLTHRDFLGAVLNLGIERKLTGDILTNKDEGWIFVLSHIADFIEENLTQVKHTSVAVSRVLSLPDALISSPESVYIITPSLRLDAVISKVFCFSRKDAEKLIASEKVFVNSLVKTKSTYELKEGDLVSARGFGRFRYKESRGDTRKGNMKILVEKF